MRPALAAVAIIALAVAGGFGSTDVAADGAVGVGVSCYGNPETATIKNFLGHRITVISVGSLFEPHATEPFQVNDKLKTSHSRTYQSGSAASVNVLTHRFIYDNKHTDGVRFTTSAGTFVSHCA